jgi:hypothetical protein
MYVPACGMPKKAELISVPNRTMQETASAQGKKAPDARVTRTKASDRAETKSPNTMIRIARLMLV